MAAPERVRALLEVAGFEKIRTDEVGVEFLFRDIEDYVQWAIDMAGPLAMVLRGLSPEELRSVTAEVEQAFAPFSAHGRYTLPGTAVCAIAH